LERSADKFNILRTKFCPPNLTSDLVPRDRLVELLDGSQEMPLTLVSAPAGYGKSVLVSQWLDRYDGLSFWFSLDEQDSHLRQFLAHLVTNLELQLPDQFQPVWTLLRSTENFAASAMSSSLANCLADLNRPCTIVLDDYHHLRNDSAVHRFLDAFLEHPPPTVHIILATRHDPPLRLISYRAANQLLEVREHDLRFDGSETTGLISSLTNKVPGPAALKNLEEQLEGWAVGLRLTSMVLKQVEDPDAFLTSLRGGIPHTQEYLLSEVLSGLDADYRDLLLKSSLLDRFCADLLAYVCMQNESHMEQQAVDASEFINFLRQNNLFVYSLDVEGRWFRFHHLFQRMLQTELAHNTDTHTIAECHRRTSQWLEGRGVLDDAIRHALLAGDEQSAIRIIEKHCYRLLEEDQAYVLFNWLGRLPAEVIDQRPVLLLIQAWVASFRQDLEQIIKLLPLITSVLKSQQGGEELWGEVDFFRGYLNFWSGDFKESVRLLSRAQGRISLSKSSLLAETDLHLGIVLHMDGEHNEAIRMIEHQIRLHGGKQLARRIGTMAFIRALSGELGDLQVTANRMLALDLGMRTPLTDGWARLFLGLAALHNFRLEAATKNLEQVIEEPHLLDRRGAIDAYAGLALAQQLEGQSEQVVSTLEQFTAFVREFDRSEELAVLGSCRVRIGLLQGADPAELRNIHRSSEAPGIFDLFLWIEAPVVSRVRRLLAEASEDSLAAAQTLIDEIRKTCLANSFTGQLIETEVLQTLLHQRMDHEEAALESLEESLALARHGGWIRPYVEAGEPMTDLLESFGANSDDDFVNQVLTACRASSTAARGPVQGPAPAGQAGRPGPAGGICDLTHRVLDIHELLAQRLQNKEIASQLFISTHTVKDHLKHIYQKLGVNNRRQAVLRAIETDLIKSN
jgi:LuxR family maltose regulon positive regulatory protein